MADTSWFRAITGAVRARIVSGARALASPCFHAALLLGFGAWLLPESGLSPSVPFLVLSGVVEELIFRLLVQGELHRFLRGTYVLSGISRANIITSVFFAGVHLIHHPPLWALSTFVPSLVFGWAMDRYKSVFPPALLHICYNILYFYRP